MEKIEKIKVFIVNAEENVRLDKILQLSAGVIMHSFVEKGDIEAPFLDSFDLKEQWIDQLETAFNESAYCGGKIFNVANAFDVTMYPLVELNDKNMMRIMYPVLFYTLILKNFNNKETVNKREKRGSKSWGNTSDLLDVPMEFSKEKGHHNVMAQLKKEIEDNLAAVKQKGSEIYAELKEMERDALTIQWEELADLQMHAEAALNLLDSRKIAWMETMAKRALLIRNILESQKGNCPPIDTVLRLYILNAIDGVVSASECMSNSVRNNDIPGEYLLTNYLESFSDLLVRQIKEDRKGVTRNSEETQGTEVSLDEPVEISDDFPLLYEQLSKLRFTQDDVEDMLDYFFQDNRLRWYLACDKHIRKYAEAVIRGLKDFENINEKHFNLECLWAPMRINLVDSIQPE